MLASARMRATRDLPLAAGLVLTGLALFFGGASSDGSLMWIGGGVLAALVALAAVSGLPRGWLTLAPLAALTAWLALSISWSALPDRSWDYADRTLVYLLFAVLGLWLASRTRELALGLTVLLGAVAVWSLGTKVLPFEAQSVIGVQSRLDAPVGLWNQLALLGDFALPLALWLALRRRTAGTLLAYAWGVAILLTLSRGGLAVGAIVVVAWIACTDERWESAATVVAAGVPAGVVAGIAFLLPGVTGEGQSSATRWHDGLLFGALLLAGAAVAALLARAPRPAGSPALRRVALAAGVVAALVVIVVGVVEARPAWHSFTSSAAVGNQGPRLSAASNFRWVWWKQAWHGWDQHPLAGTGAGTFHVTNLRYRTSYLDFATEPHDLPVQFLSEAGGIGLLLFAAACLALLWRGHGRRGHELALALILPAYLLHGLVDIDWDFLAVSAPAFLVAGALAGRAAPHVRLSGFAVLSATGVALIAFGVLLLPWLGDRWSNDALFASTPARTVTLAERARSVDPLLVEPLWTEAGVRKDPRKALALYAEAVRKQPQNAQAWLLKAQFELQYGCPRLALADLYTFVALDPYERPDRGPDDYRRALALVNSGKPTC